MSGFARLLRAEWIKLRSVRRWLVTFAGVAALAVGFSYFIATTSSSDANRHQDFAIGPAGVAVRDDFHFAHRPLTGDGVVVARVAGQADSHPEAGAGLMVKDGLRQGSPYAAVMVTPSGVRLSADYTTDEAGTTAAAPYWLRLVRTGDRVTASASADGRAWSDVGSVRLALPPTVEVGLFVTSPPEVRVERNAGSTSVGEIPTVGTATFDQVTVDGRAAEGLTGEDVGVARRGKDDDGGGSTRETGGVYTLTGSGAIGPYPIADDVVQISLIGALFGVMALIAVSVLFMTSEFRRRMIRTTFAATGGRGRVLAAKAVVLGAVAFAVGLPANLTAFLVAGPALRANGFAPPAFPSPSLTDPAVVRAIVGSAVFMALIAVFSLAVGAILRHSAGAIAGIVLLILVPTVVASVLPLGAARWLMRLTPAGGFAVQRAKPPTDTLVEPFAMIGPWAGLGVAAAYAAGALALGAWLLRRRDA